LFSICLDLTHGQRVWDNDDRNGDTLHVGEGYLEQEVIKPQDIIDAQDDAILIVGQDYVIENINRSGRALLGKGRKNVKGKKCYQAFYFRTRPCEHCPFTKTLKTKKGEVIEQYDKKLSRHFRIKSTPKFNKKGEVIKAICSMRDVTELVETEAKQKRMQQELSLNRRLVAIGQIAAGITHEINNPLTGVIAFAQMLMQMDIPENMKEAVEVIHEGAVRVVGIVDRLRTFARSDRQENEYADINTIITNTLTMLSYEMRSNDIEVTTHLAENLPRTMANTGQLQQVFLNIIINAEQAMATSPRRAKLTITTEQFADRIIVSIRDNGPGIPEETINEIFDPFFTTKDNYSGMGLGLNVSRNIITEHGGEIRVWSKPGLGATFIIDLPIVTDTGEGEPGEPADTEQGEPVGARILVVDDEPHICRALDRLLTNKGHLVDTTPSPLTALEMLRDKRYDLILLDLRMPDMSGIELYERIGIISPSLQRKVICVTGDVVSSQNEAFLHKTGIPCVAKPFGVNELMRQVKQVLEGENKDAQVTYSHS
jgi:nitrogen-specific signal transduction histidine kinase/CheY-like chemotaxis protein